jgi:2-phospho-L-lactate guanylyltransferase
VPWHDGNVRWRLLIPIKPAAAAKTRLQEATRTATAHQDLVRAIQIDTLDAVERALDDEAVAGAYVLSAAPVPYAPGGLSWLADTGAGLNAALASAADELRRRHPDDAVLALVADLPALRTGELLAVLDRAARVRRGYVADEHGSGTTALSALPGEALRPAFGARSAARHHASGARPIEAGRSVRADVDTVADLHRCLAFGAGPRTVAVAGTLLRGTARR